MADQGNRTATPAVDDGRIAEQERLLREMRRNPQRIADDLRRQTGGRPEYGDQSDQ